MAVLGLIVGCGIRLLSSPDYRPDSNAAPETLVSHVRSGLETDDSPVSANDYPEDLDRAGNFVGSAARPAIDQVLSSRGLERHVLLARFLADAYQAELRTLFETWDKDRAHSTYTSDAIFLRWTELDREGAFAFAKEHDRTYAVVWCWAKSDPDAALAYALEHGDATSAARAIAQSDPDRGAAILAAHPELAGNSVWEGVASGLAITDNKAAAKYALDHDVDTKNALRRWARSDPEEAIAFANGRPDPKERQKALAEAIAGVSDDDPAKAFALASDLPAGALRAKILADLISDDSRTDEFISRFLPLMGGADADSDIITQALAARKAPTDPDAALELLANISFERLQSATGSVRYRYDGGGGSAGRWGSSSDGGIESIVETVSASRPEETLELLASHPSTEIANGLTTKAAQRWVELAPDDASRWIADVPPGPGRDAMVVGLAKALTEGGSRDYESALAWALTMDPAGQFQEGALTGLFEQWSKHDPAASLAAMEREAGRAGGGGAGQ